MTKRLMLCTFRCLYQGSCDRQCVYCTCENKRCI